MFRIDGFSHLTDASGCSRRFFLKTTGLYSCVMYLSGETPNDIKSKRRQIPVIASDWIRVVDYPENHLNDFCIFQDTDGIWHCMGIMGTGTWNSETSLFHCSSLNLLEHFKTNKSILTTLPPAHLPPQKHAPFVVFNEGYYHLFYRRPPGTILVVRSADPFNWPDLGFLVFEERDARDICIIKDNNMFLMYYCQSIFIDGFYRSAILMRKSKDLCEWSDAETVFLDTIKSSEHSYLESPFVVRRPEGYYIFIRHRLLEETCSTVVIFSDFPNEFPSGERTWFVELNHVHAPEIVSHEGKYYIARVSGPRHGNKFAPQKGGWIEIAELKFSDTPE